MRRDDLQPEADTAAESPGIFARHVIEAIQNGHLLLPEYINQQSAARYCGYSKQFFNKVCRSGSGPRHVMVGTRWRARRVWLDQWMESGGPHAPQPP